VDLDATRKLDEHMTQTGQPGSGVRSEPGAIAWVSISAERFTGPLSVVRCEVDSTRKLSAPEEGRSVYERAWKLAQMGGMSLSKLWAGVPSARHHRCRQHLD